MSLFWSKCADLVGHAHTVTIGRLVHGDVRGEGGRAKVARVALQVGKV